MLNSILVVPNTSHWANFIALYQEYLDQNWAGEQCDADLLIQRYTEGPRAFLLLCDDKVPVGFANVWIDTQNPDVANVAEFYIRPLSQRQGYGRLLWGQILRWTGEKAVQAVHLETDVHKEPANQFWRALGFKKISADEMRVQYARDWHELWQVQEAAQRAAP